MFFFQDDNFSVDVKRVKSFCDQVIEQKMDIKFGLMGTRIDTLKYFDDEMFSKLHQAGCLNIDIGIESGSDRILQLMSKAITVADIHEVNARIKHYDFIIKFTFIIGFPTESDEEINQTIDLAMKLAAENSHAYTPFYIATPYPGTGLYKQAIENGLKPPQSLEEWALFDRDQWYNNYPCWLSPQKIKKLEMITFVAFLYNKNIKFKITSPIFKFFFNLYQPIAHFRMKHKYFGLPFELWVKKILNKND